MRKARRFARGLVLVAAALAVVLAACDRVPQIDQLVLVNDTEFDILVEVRSDDGDSWLSLGVAPRRSETPKEDLIDQGSTWVFRFSYAGEQMGEIATGRDELARDGWRLTIPNQVEEEIRARGFTPPGS